MFKLQFVKEISDIGIILPSNKYHWDNPWPILCVPSPNNRISDQEYPEPEVENLKTPGGNMIGLRQK